MGPQEGEQYRHVSVVQPLACPDLKCLKTINSISSEWLSYRSMQHAGLL
jgi:hypothetical protein